MTMLQTAKKEDDKIILASKYYNKTINEFNGCGKIIDGMSIIDIMSIIDNIIYEHFNHSTQLYFDAVTTRMYVWNPKLKQYYD
jgi:hypothetical protein